VFLVEKSSEFTLKSTWEGGSNSSRVPRISTVFPTVLPDACCGDQGILAHHGLIAAKISRSRRCDSSVKKKSASEDTCASTTRALEKNFFGSATVVLFRFI
jgi:hypothetical protein